VGGFERVGNLLVQPRQEVAVGVERDPDRAVAEPRSPEARSTFTASKLSIPTRRRAFLRCRALLLPFDVMA
jgi:hypothetical protein